MLANIMLALISEKKLMIVLNRSEQVMNLARRIFANGYQSILGWCTGIATIIAPAVPLIGTAFLFIILDLIYGYKVYRKFTGHKDIESGKLWNTLEKLMFASVMIAGFTLLDKFVFMTYVDLVLAKVAAGAICFAEIISLLESRKALKPNSIITKLLSKIIKSKAEKYLDVDISDIIEDQKNINTITNDTSTDKLSKK